MYLFYILLYIYYTFNQDTVAFKCETLWELILTILSSATATELLCSSVLLLPNSAALVERKPNFPINFPWTRVREPAIKYFNKY